MRPWMPRKDLTEKDFEVMGLPKRYWSADFAKIQDESVRANLKKYLLELKENRDAGIGFMISGANGTGKTMAASIGLRAFRAHGQGCYYALPTDFTSIRINDDAKWQYLQEVDVLLIDDLGKEFSRKSDFAIDCTSDLLRARWAKQLVTLMTTNLAITSTRNNDEQVRSGLPDVYRRSTLSVMTDSTKVWVMKGPDLRREKTRKGSDLGR